MRPPSHACYVLPPTTHCTLLLPNTAPGRHQARALARRSVPFLRPAQSPVPGAPAAQPAHRGPSSTTQRPLV